MIRTRSQVSRPVNEVGSTGHGSELRGCQKALCKRDAPVYENLRAFVGEIQQVYAQHHHKRHGGGAVSFGRVASRGNGLTNLDEHFWSTAEPSMAGRSEYTEALSHTADDEWMRKQMLRAVIGTDSFL